MLDKEYTPEQYEIQFTTRIPENLRKLERIEAIYRKDVNTPKAVFDVMEEQRQRLQAAKAQFGEYVSPLVLIKK